MIEKKQGYALGVHISVAGGLEQAIIKGTALGCSAIQIFTKSNRQWFAKELTQESISLFKKTVQNSPIVSIVAHAAYLINLASPNKEIAEKSAQALSQELLRCNLLDIPYLVLHPGSRGTSADEEATKQIIFYLNSILNQNNGKTFILLETMAGQGSSVCHTFTQIANIIEHIDKKDRIGVCFDTCHAFAAGYTFNTPDLYESLWLHFDQTIGLHNLKVIHLNDSKKGCGSLVDRHEHIGKGMIGIEAFSLLINDPKLYSIPKILETPKESESDDKRNIETIMNLMNEKTREFIKI